MFSIWGVLYYRESQDGERFALLHGASAAAGVQSAPIAPFAHKLWTSVSEGQIAMPAPTHTEACSILPPPLRK
jgi:hypothetical protein